MSIAGETAFAHGHGGSRNWHGGGHDGGHWHGSGHGNWHGHGGHVGVYLGAPLILPAPYYTPYPAVVTVPASPTAYVEQDGQVTPDPDSGYWYYCPDAKAYYPYVKECPGGWQQVTPQPPPPQQ